MTTETTLTTEATEAVLAWIVDSDQTEAGQAYLDDARDHPDHDGDDDDHAAIRDWIGDTMRLDLPSYMLDTVLRFAAQCDAAAIVADLDDRRPDDDSDDQD
jgi:hypothetical protein